MDEINFRNYLKTDEKNLTEKGIQSRIAKAKKAEKLLNLSLDDIVKNDEAMLEALNNLQKFENPSHNPMQNAVRKYYKFKNNKDFPRKKDF